MALRAKITEVTYEADGVDEDGNPITIDLSVSGQFMFSADYFDSAAPATILYRHNWTVPYTVQISEASNLVIAEGQKVRSARQRVAELQPQVGAVIVIP